MARIRTVKPELFRHEELYELEKSTGVPMRTYFIAMFTCCDRQGRFKWKPRQLKLDCAPYDNIDFSRVLDALAMRGFIVKYASKSAVYGCIPTFTSHQVINNREKESELPCYTDEGMQVIECKEELTREARVGDASSTPLNSAQAEGKGREGNMEGERNMEEEGIKDCGKVEEGKEITAHHENQKPKVDTKPTWQAYIDAYRLRYGVEPVRNQQVNSQMAKFCKSIPIEDAPYVADFYVRHNDAYYVKQAHPVGLLLQHHQKLYTEARRGIQVTSTTAMQVDRTQGNVTAVEEAIASMRKKGKIQ